MTGIDDAVLIPVYNEATTIENVLNAVRAHHRREIIIVDDGSTDATAAVLEEREDILILPHPENMGYGRSLIDGFEYARFIGIKRLITMDCDGQHEPAHIPEFFARMDADDADIVSGSRYLPDSLETHAAPGDRKEVNDRVTERINEVTGWGLTDAFCGFKGYHLDRIAFALTEPGYGMPLELWAKAHHAGLTIEELPVERIYCDHGRSFGTELDDAETRFAYYMDVWNTALGTAG